MSVKWLTKRDKNGKLIRYSVPWYDDIFYWTVDPGSSAGSQPLGSWDLLNQFTFDQLSLNTWDQIGT